jgi:glyoxylate reductase
MKPKVFVTRTIPDSGLSVLKEKTDVIVNQLNYSLTKEMLINSIRDVQGLVCLLTDSIDKDVIEAGKELKIISNYAVGYDNIDVSEATKRGIMVTNTPGVLTDTTADLTWALIFSIARRIVEADKFVREGKFNGWDPMLFLGSDISKSVLGIIGFGRIGRAVAERAKGFSMTVLYSDTNRMKQDAEEELGVEYKPMKELLALSDFITLHIPLNRSTYHLIGQNELKIMKKEAYLINTARGSLVDENALIHALKNNWIAGAALDVFENEPALSPELSNLKNVVIVPHIGSASFKTRNAMALSVANNILAVLKGELPPNLINKEISLS